MAPAPSSLGANTRAPEAVGTPTVSASLGSGPPSSIQSPVSGTEPSAVGGSATTNGARVACSGPITVRAGAVFVPLHCLSNPSCLLVTVQLVVVERVAGATANDQRTTARTVIVGRTGVTLGVGQSRTLRISLNQAGRRLLGRSRSLVAQVRVTLNGYTVASQRIGLDRAALGSRGRATPTGVKGAV